MGSRDAYALNIVSLERAPASSTVWTTWTPWRRDADAAPLRSVCEPHVLAVEANAHSNWINDIVFSHDDLDLLRYALAPLSHFMKACLMSSFRISLS